VVELAFGRRLVVVVDAVQRAARWVQELEAADQEAGSPWNDAVRASASGQVGRRRCSARARRRATGQAPGGTRGLRGSGRLAEAV
jgi:hypothetical protein